MVKNLPANAGDEQETWVQYLGQKDNNNKKIKPHFQFPLQHQLCFSNLTLGFPDGSVVKNLSANAGDTRDIGTIPGWGRSPGIGNSNPLHSILA